MANSPSSIKRARQNPKRRLANGSRRSAMRTRIRRVMAALASGDRENAAGAYAIAVPVLDRMAARGLIHKNKAARHKRRLNKRLRAPG